MILQNNMSMLEAYFILFRLLVFVLPIEIINEVFSQFFFSDVVLTMMYQISNVENN